MKAAADRVRRVKAGEDECMVHGVQSPYDARYLTRSDLMMLGEAYLALGEHVLSETTIDDGCIWIKHTFLQEVE